MRVEYFFKLYLFLNFDMIYLIKRMNFNIEPVLLNVHNYAMFKPYIANFLKKKRLWQYMKVTILDPKDDQSKFVINENEG